MSIYDELALEDPEAAALKIQNAMRAYLARKYPDGGIDDDVDDEDDVEDDDEYDDEDEEDDQGDEDDDEDDEDDEDDGVERNPPVFYNLPATPSSMIPMCSLLCTMMRVYLNLTKLLCRLKRVSLQRAVVETRAACNIQKAFRGYLARKHAGKFGLVNQKHDDYDTDSITSEDSSYYSEDSDDDEDDDDEEDGVERNPPLSYILPTTPSSRNPLSPSPTVSLQRAVVERRAARCIQKAFRGYLARKYPGKFDLVNQKLDHYDTDSITSEDSSYYSEDSDDDEDDDDEEDGVERNPPLSYILPTTPSSRNPLSPSPTVSLQRAVVERRAARNIQKAFRGYLARKYPGKFDLVNQKLDHYDTDSITSEDSSSYSDSITSEDEGIISENGEEEEEETGGRADDAQEIALFRGGIEELRRAMEVLREKNQNLKTLLD